METNTPEVDKEKDLINTAADTALWNLQNELSKEHNLQVEVKKRIIKPTKKPIKQEPQKRYKWAVADVDGSWKFDHINASPVPDLKSIDWDSGIKGSERSESGAEGVFFVELNSGGVVVVKGPKSVAEEFFTNLLALKLGICVPRLRVVCRDGIEGTKLVNGILQTDKLGSSIYGLQGVHHFLFKEYILAKI